MNSKRLANVVFAILAAAQLAGCSSSNNSPSTSTPPGNNGGGTGTGGTGGGGGDGGGTGGGGTGGDGDGGGTDTPALAAISGVFVDAPVAGLSYSTSSELTGVTDAEGRYDYRPGDTVTFSIGNLQLGTVTAQGVVTPMTVAAVLAANASTDAETIAANVAVLLQSLDANGDPSDGITVAPAVSEKITSSSIDLTASANTFTAAVSTFVANVAAEAGVTLQVVDRDVALDHFKSEAKVGLAGHYVRADENFAPITEKIVTLSVFRNGRYLLGGQHDSATCNLSSGTPVSELAFSDSNGNGVEYGAYAWNPLTNAFEVSGLSVETDGLCGFNQPVEGATNGINLLEATPQGLVFKDTDGNVSYRFVRKAEDASTFEGAWVQLNALLVGQPFVFSFFPSSEDGLSGRYLMVDASALDTEYDVSPGIEEGCYAVDANDNLTVDLTSTCASAIDTNNTAGASDTSALKMYVDENDRLVIEDDEDVTGFARMPLPTISYETLAGAWIAQLEPDVELGDQENLSMLTMFKDGRYLFGAHHDDPSCVSGGYPYPDLDEDGNGVEFGTINLVNGAFTTTTTVDSDGECGLFDATKEFTQRYVLVPNAAGDALVMWSNDDDSASGLVWKRVPSTPDTIYGAWLWTEGADDEFAVVAYLPGGYMFEAAVFPDMTGILREKFDFSEAPVMRSQNTGYEFCVDTESAPGEGECDRETTDLIEENYYVDGDIVTDDEEGTYTRIK